MSGPDHQKTLDRWFDFLRTNKDGVAIYEDCAYKLNLWHQDEQAKHFERPDDMRLITEFLRLMDTN